MLSVLHSVDSLRKGFWKRLNCLGSANSAPFNDLVVYIVFDVMIRVPFLDSQKDTTTHWELCVVWYVILMNMLPNDSSCIQGHSCLNNKTKCGIFLCIQYLIKDDSFFKYKLLLLQVKWDSYVMHFALFGLTGWLSSWFWKLKMFVHRSKGWNIGRLFILEMHKGAD